MNEGVFNVMGILRSFQHEIRYLLGILRHSKKTHLLRGFLWGTKGEKIFRRLMGKKFSRKAKITMRKLERMGLYAGYGFIPVSLTVNGFVLGLAEVMTRFLKLSASPLAYGVSILSWACASISTQFPVSRQAIKKYGDVGACVRNRQIKVYATGLATGFMIVATTLVAPNKNGRLEVAHTMSGNSSTPAPIAPENPKISSMPLLPQPNRLVVRPWRKSRAFG